MVVLNFKKKTIFEGYIMHKVTFNSNLASSFVWFLACWSLSESALLALRELEEVLESCHWHLVVCGWCTLLNCSWGWEWLFGGRCCGFLSLGNCGSLWLAWSKFSNLCWDSWSSSLSTLLGRCLSASLCDSLGTTLNLSSWRWSSNSFCSCATKSNNLGGSVLEVPVVFSSNNSLIDTSLTEKWYIWGWEFFKVGLNWSVSEVLDSGLEFVITVKVWWPSGWCNVFTKLWFEAVNNKTNFEATVAGEDAVAVDTFELESPVCD